MASAVAGAPRILFVPLCWRQPCGGSDIYLLNFAQRLAATGRYDVEIASAAPAGAIPRPIACTYAPITEFALLSPSLLARAVTRLIWRGERLRSWLQRLGWRPGFRSSPDLLAFIRQRGSDFQAIVTGPYVSKIVADTIFAAPAVSVLLPCLHDEREARTHRTGAILRAAAVRIFNSDSERALAARLHGSAATAGSVVGIGMDAPDAIAPEAEVRARYDITGDYLVYVGRQESAKGLPGLVAMLKHHNLRHPEASISLVMVGAGRFRPRPASWLRRTGFTDERTKFGLMQGALANITFSRLESLSISLLEGWSLGVPAIVHAASDVLRAQVERSLGGYIVSDDASFAAAVQQLRQPSIREAKGSAGASFVARHYAWDDVMARFIAALSPLFGEAQKI